MPPIRYLNLLLLVCFVSSCTFGEGPELILPESDESISTDANESGSDSTESSSVTAPVNGNSGQTQAMTQVQSEQSVVSGAGNDMQGVNTQSEDTQAGGDASQLQDDTQSGIVRIPRTDTANAPRINGDTIDYVPGTKLLDGEWRFAAQSNAAGEPLGINRFMFGKPEQALSGSYHHWAAMHDGEYLYLVVVSDDNGLNFQDTNEVRKPWRDDSVELYFDGNHSRLEQYDGVDDFQLTVNLLSSNGIANNSNNSNSLLTPSTSSAPLPSDLVFSAGPGKGPQSVDSNRVRKDIYEFRIKLSELNIQLDKPFGFEVQLSDDDDGGDRDAKWAWQHPEGVDDTNDNTWQNPGFMGTAILVR